VIVRGAIATGLLNYKLEPRLTQLCTNQCCMLLELPTRAPRLS
jgi:hypothetical protein